MSTEHPWNTVSLLINICMYIGILIVQINTTFILSIHKIKLL